MTQKSLVRRAFAAGVVALIFASITSACSPTNTGPLVSPSASSSASPAELSALFPVGDGREMYLECTGEGSPTVILIGGLRAAADYWVAENVDAALAVAPAVSEFTRVCSYDRPGTVRQGNAFSRSDPIRQPSSEESAVADLHALLTSADVTGPFVLAAHSYGGFIARLYASSYPDDVVGMVLIDALSEGFEAALSEQEYAHWLDSQQVSPDDIAEYPGIERLDMAAVLSQIRSAPPMKQMPMVVLSADRLYAPSWASMITSGQLPADTPPELGAAIDRAQEASQRFQADLVPGALHITKTNSGHDIPLENPTAVISAIRDIVCTQDAC